MAIDFDEEILTRDQREAKNAAEISAQAREWQRSAFRRNSKAYRRTERERLTGFKYGFHS